MSVGEEEKGKSVAQEYARDGAAVVRGVVDPELLEELRVAVDSIIQNPAPTSTDYRSDEGEGRFFGDFFMWRNDPVFDRFARCPQLIELAAAALGTDELYFFYDQLLVKEPGTSQATPLHQDLPYWPLRGDQVITLWIPLDPVNVDSGAVHYVRGSHRWGETYAPQAFSPDSEFAAVFAEMNLLPPPELNEIKAQHECLVWDTEPGDVVVHHPLTLHFGNGNSSKTTRRRAIAMRYMDKSVRYDDRPGTFMQSAKLESIANSISLKSGDLFRGPLFPRVRSPLPNSNSSLPAT